MYVNVCGHFQNMSKNILKLALSQRERLFVEHYIVCSTGSEAAMLAGYTSNPASQASRLLRRHRVTVALDQARKQLAERNNTDGDRIIAMLYKSYETSEKKGDSVGMLKAAREIGLLCGFYDNN